MNKTGWIVAGCVASALTGSVTSRAAACSCVEDAFVESNPKSSAGGVPRNQAIVIQGDVDPDTMVLERLDGQTHAFSVLAHELGPPCGGGYAIEMIPTPALDPETHYEVRADRIQGPGTLTLRFSTSSELLPDPELKPPSGDVFLTRHGLGTSCGPVAAIGCVTADDPSDVEIVVRNGETILQRLTVAEKNQQLFIWEKATCIDLQRRAPTGRRSQPLSFCGEALVTRPSSDGELCGWAEGGSPMMTPDAVPDPAGASAPDPDEPRATSPPASDAAPSADHANAQRRSYGCAAYPGDAPAFPRLSLLALLGLAMARRRLAPNRASR